MCGIEGTNSAEVDIKTPLIKMKRGDDERRILSWQDVRFGFQRHSIVAPDQSTTQPFHTGDWITVANGELFGHERIQEGLQTPPPPGCVDTQVLHHFIAENGVAAVSNLNMMMAGAAYNTRKRILYLYRDWVGETPLHYIHNPVNGEWFFGSDIATVVRATNADVDSVMEVPPGSIVAIDSSKVTTTPYFDITKTPNLHGITLEQAAQKVRKLLEESAQERTWTGVPVASLISGGVDSLITTYLLLKYGKFEGPLPVYTFHCSDFPEDEKSDLFHARKVVEWFGDKVDHRIVSVSQEQIIDSIPEVVHGLEDVRGRDFNVFTAVYNRFLAERIASDNIKLVYEGEGPDEALGSYSAWRSFQFTDEEIGDPALRKKLVSNLHKGVLPRTSKVMMNFGPLECRSFFLDREVLTYLSSLPISAIRDARSKKAVFVEAFKGDIPEELLVRPKARPQDSTGITAILSEHLIANNLDFRQMFRDSLKNR